MQEKLPTLVNNTKNKSETNPWAAHFFQFLTLPEAQNHLQELFNAYLQSDDADNKQDRNQKLFLHDQIQELLVTLNKQ